MEEAGASFVGCILRFGIGFYRDHDHRQLAMRCIVPNGLQKFESVHARHVVIDQNYVETASFQRFQACFARLGHDDPCLLVAEEGRNELVLNRIIIDHEHPQEVVREPVAGHFHVIRRGHFVFRLQWSKLLDTTEMITKRLFNTPVTWMLLFCRWYCRLHGRGASSGVGRMYAAKATISKYRCGILCGILTFRIVAMFAFLVTSFLIAGLVAAFGAGYWFSQFRSRSYWIPANERGAIEAELESLRDEIWELKEEEAAREKAEAANEAKTRFLATVSHEMRTPLNGILGMAELIAQPGLSAEQKTYVEAISTSGKALASLIDEILDFAKIEAGRIELLSEPFDATALVEGVAELLAPRAQGKGLEIATAIDPRMPPKLIGDPARLRQVLLNLAGNAVKFTSEGGVGLRASWKEPGLFRVEISDTGPGIPFARQAAIFDEFEQADGSSSRSHEGTGLGLAISRRIVESMGGQLNLERSGPDGSVFAFELPLMPIVAATPSKPSSENLAGRQVLIVARSPFEAPYMGERLDAAGAAVLRAQGEDEALDMLNRTASFDIVIVDCALGEEATQRIAVAARDAGVSRSLVLFSPFERRAFGQKTMQEFDGWLVKPVRAVSLLQRLADKAPQPELKLEIVAPAPEIAAQASFHVLVAEDNDINALIACTHLERMGAVATRARDGLEALNLVSQSFAGSRPQFALVLMDIRMPQLDGIEATRRIRALEKDAARSPIRIIALTANAFDEDRRACLEAGIDQFLTKPVDFEGLSNAILPIQDTPRSA